MTPPLDRQPKRQPFGRHGTLNPQPSPSPTPRFKTTISSIPTTCCRSSTRCCARFTSTKTPSARPRGPLASLAPRFTRRNRCFSKTECSVCSLTNGAQADRRGDGVCRPATIRRSFAHPGTTGPGVVWATSCWSYFAILYIRSPAAFLGRLESFPHLCCPVSPYRARLPAHGFHNSRSRP